MCQPTRRRWRTHLDRWAALLGCLVLVSAGCSSSSGGLLPFDLRPRHELLESAKAVRQPQPQPLPRELNKSVLPTYVVEPGDGLLIQPADLGSPVRLPASQTILPDGTIDLSRYGRLRVAGMTVEDVEKAVQAKVKAEMADAGPIIVRLGDPRSKIYYVLGEVNSPGVFPLSGRETVLDAILAAGGLNSKASLQNIILSRPSAPDGCRTVLPICYREIVQLGDTTTNYQIAPGDRVFVPTRGLRETLCPKKAECAPCGGPQSACPSLAPDHGHSTPLIEGTPLGGPPVGTGPAATGGSPSPVGPVP